MVSKAIALTLLVSTSVAAQQQPPDTTRRPQQLPAIETRAPRDERTSFETRPNVGTITITGKELTSVPKFFGESDVLRAIRTLPGVNARNDFSVGMNVRGGEADQNLVLLDGYPIYNPFHMGGLFGAFVEPMVDRVDFLTGGFPASYGGRLSSVLDVHSATEPRSGVHGQVDMSFIATTLALGGGLQNGRGTWGVAAQVRRQVRESLRRRGPAVSLPRRAGTPEAGAPGRRPARRHRVQQRRRHARLRDRRGQHVRAQLGESAAGRQRREELDECPA